MEFSMLYFFHRRRSAVWRLFVVSAWIAVSTCILAGCGVPAETAPAGTFGLDFSLPPDAQRKGAMVFFVDGVNAEIFQEMLDSGQLPAIKHYFADRGLYAPRAATNIPSVTIPNLVSLATGVFPGHHNVMGVNWFDRNQLIWRNYNTIAQKDTVDCDYTAPSIYEQFPDELTFSLFFQPHRGATKFYENWASAGPPLFLGYYEYIDRLSLYRLGEMMEIARQYKRFPAITIIYMLSPDFRAYQNGVSKAPYRQSLLHIDRQIGRVLADLERAGLLEHVVIALLTDHGMVDVKHHFNYRQFLEKQVGLKVGLNHWWENDPFEERLEDHRKINVVPYGSGDRYFALCMRKPIFKGDKCEGFEPWVIRPSADDLRKYPASGKLVDLPARLIGQEAVDCVAFAAGPNRVRLLRRGGEVELAQPAGRGGDIFYKIIAGKDPLNWEGKVSQAMLAGAGASPRQWLDTTISTDYPDLPAQILAYFRAQRCGDLVVFGAKDWDFNNIHRSGHGAVTPGDMHIPILLAGPGVPHGRIASARAVDVFPTLLTLLGRPVPPGLDGQSLVPFEALQAPEKSAATQAEK